ncbi:MAG TPA: thioesterase family protein [Clostridia bacterium]|nr:thioesterase family protein [Clostridia bacterium]
MDPVHRFEILVTPEVVDRNGHVNNVAYVQWMQDAAVRHAASTGCTAATEAIGATWVARTHQVEYLVPARPGDTVLALTWVVNVRKVRSLRRYKFLRGSDQAVLATGETDWVFIDATTGRPRSIPPEVSGVFTLVEEEW